VDSAEINSVGSLRLFFIITIIGYRRKPWSCAFQASKWE